MSAKVLWVWFATRDRMTARQRAAIIAHFGRVEQVYAADRRMLAEVPGMLRVHMDTLCDKDTRAAEDMISYCDSRGISLLTIADAGYPDRLRQIADPPALLYVRGSLPDLDSSPGLAIVGTRNSTPYGNATALSMSAGLAKAGFVVVTGMARGIDGEANRGALRAGGKTVAVLGCGVDVCYPPEHRALMGDILLSGAVISEYPPGTQPLPRHFPVRNRIISGLCVGTLVIEAPRRSGALITAREALEQGREVFIVPGAVDVESFRGSNEMISRGEAQLVSKPLDIVREFAGLLRDEQLDARVDQVLERQTGMRAENLRPRCPVPEPPPVVPVKTIVHTHSIIDGLPSHLSDNERAIITAVSGGATSVDEVVRQTGLSAPCVTSSITMLELDGLIEQKGGRLTVELLP